MSTAHITSYNRQIWAALPAALLFILHLLFQVFVHDLDRLILLADIITVLISTWAAVAMFLAARQARSASRELVRFWRLMGFAQLALALGETGWFVYEIILGESPFPSFADPLYLLYYPLFLIAIHFLPGSPRTQYGWTKNTIDMLIVFLAAILVVWNFVLGPLIEAGSTGPLLGQLLSLAYPVGDIVQIWALIQLVYRLPNSPIRVPIAFLAAGGVVTVVMDCIFGYQNLNGTYQTATILDIGYTVGYLFYGMAGVWMAANASHPDPEEEEVSSTAENPFWLSHMPYAWVLGSYLLLILQPTLHLPMNQTEIALFVGVIILLVIYRQVIVMNENQNLYVEVERQSQELEEANWDLQAEINIRRRAEEKLSHDAMHDSLTGLPNRAFFAARLKHVARYKQYHPEFQYSVLFLDLDKFKVVNDSLGHATGDQLLVQVARILPECVRTSDTVARLGGDEFVILLEDIRDTGGVLQIANRILNDLGHPFHLDGSRVFVTTSIGIVLNVNENEPADDILQDADLAMYHAKAAGKARYAVFEPQMRAHARQRLLIENDLRRGIETGEFCLVYQPVFSLPDRRLISLEALVRWQHPHNGLLPPSEFLHLAEETGLILPLGGWIIDEVCRQARAWLDTCPPFADLRINVNLSAGQISDPALLTRVRHALNACQVPGQRLSFEITESLWNEQHNRLRILLPQFKVLGIQCHMDHFGVGHSSLHSLNAFPISTAKIDIRMFHPAKVGLDQPDMVAALINLLKEMRVQSIAAGVENKAELDALVRLGCTGAQGYALARPMEAARVSQWLIEYTPPVSA